MISYLEGKVQYLGEKWAIISAGPIGYKVTLLPKLLNILAKNKQNVNPTSGTLTGPQDDEILRLFIHSQLNMREGTFDLYGFDKKGEPDLFSLLLTVSGIGPKGAMTIMSTVEPHHLKSAVINEDAGFLKKVSGLGPKTAQRLVLELKNKIDSLAIDGEIDINLDQKGEVLDALVALGYSQGQALEAIKEVGTGKTLQEQIKGALKLLGKR